MLSQIKDFVPSPAVVVAAAVVSQSLKILLVPFAGRNCSKLLPSLLHFYRDRAMKKQTGRNETPIHVTSLSCQKAQELQSLP